MKFLESPSGSVLIEPKDEDHERKLLENGWKPSGRQGSLLHPKNGSVLLPVSQSQRRRLLKMGWKEVGHE